MRIPTHLTDTQLIDAVTRCVREERAATVQLVAHLAEMDARRLHLDAGFPSLYQYCLDVLRLSEGAAYKRIEVARAARRFPVVLDRLADGSLSLATAAAVARKLTGENHQELIAAVAGRSKRAVEELLARRFPQPDLATSIRRASAAMAPPRPLETAVPAVPAVAIDAPTAVAVAPAVVAPPLTQPRSADRYRVAFMAGAATVAKLRRAQELLRHAVPDGDPAQVVDRALTLLIADLERKKCGAVRRPAKTRRPIADDSRHVPDAVKRAVWARDGGRCAFRAPSGRRCGARAFIEYHHVEPYAVGGPPTVANIQLRCRAHNQHEAVIFYGPGHMEKAREVAAGSKGHKLSARDSTSPGTSRRQFPGMRAGGGA